ncbi:MAG: DUF3078 domain-containing protein [Paludibacteraceae bacterium]|nr:DUF3078 domain-containing protein [Paludibacteraceae bacterium]
MKKAFLIIAAICTSVVMLAEDEAAPVKDWAWSGIVGINANATGMVNWAAGGKNNVTGTAYGKVRCLYDKNGLSWDTNLDVAYGLSYVDQTYDKMQKASDYLKFNTKFGWAFAKQWYLTVNAGFQTQFDLGREYKGTGEFNPVLSNILAPSYTDISVGIDWKPNSIFSVYLSPVAGRITTAYVSDKVNKRFEDQYPIIEGKDDGLRQKLQEDYGVWKYTDNGDNGYTREYRNAKAELGLTLKGNINYTYKDLKIITGVTIYTPYAWDKTKLYHFIDVEGTEYIFSENQQALAEKKGLVWEDGEYLGYRDNNRRFGNFDVDWNVAISYQFLKCLSVSLATDLKYVNGLSINGGKEKVQFLANLGLGVSYAF